MSGKTVKGKKRRKTEDLEEKEKNGTDTEEDKPPETELNEEKSKPEPSEPKSRKGGAVAVVLILILGSFAVLFYNQFVDKEEGEGNDIPNGLPLADAGGDRNVKTLDPLLFDGGRSRDPDGTIVSYFWSFGDGSTSSEKSPEHVYTKAGLYGVTLRVKDNDGNSANDTAFIRVLNRAPEVHARVQSGSITVFQLVRFNGTASDPDGFITKYDWDFDGNGNSDWSAKTTGITTHHFTLTGVYNAKLTVMDDNGAVNSTSVTITVTGIPNNPPLALAGTDQVSGTGKVTLFGTGSDPDNNIVLYEWDFDGDGNYTWSSTENGIANHSYETEGSFNASFRVTDAFGLQAVDSVNIKIDNQIITGNLGASVLIDWNETQDGKGDFNYIFKLNNSFEPVNLTIFIKYLSSGINEQYTYPDSIQVHDNLTVTIESSRIPSHDDRIAIEVFYLGYLIGQRDLEFFRNFQRQLLNPYSVQTANYSYSTDLKLVLGDSVREENHSGIMKLEQLNKPLKYYYKGSGEFKITTEIEDSTSIFDLGKTEIYRNGTWQDGEAIQESLEIRGSGHYTFQSPDGAEFDIPLDKFVLKEENGNRTDFYYYGKGQYSNYPVSGTIEREYDLLGLDFHDNWEGIYFKCERYKIETIIEYSIEDEKYTIFNASFIWVVAEDGSYEDSTIYFQFVYRYSVNDLPVEQRTGSYYPPGAPKSISQEDDIFTVLDMSGIIPLSFNTGDSLVLSGKTGFKIKYDGTTEGKKQIGKTTYTTITVIGNVISTGEGTYRINMVNSGKYTGWVLSRYEDIKWNNDRIYRKLELLL